MNKKRIAVTLFMAFLSEIANKLAPLVTLHIVAARLGTAAFGGAQYALWLLDWGIFVTVYGFTQTAPVLLRAAKNPDDQAKVAGEVLGGKLLLAAISALILLFATRDHASLSEYRPMIAASIFALVTTALDCVWVLLARQKMAVISALSIVAKFSSVLAVLFFIENPDHATRFVVITCLANSLISIASFFVASKVVGFKMPEFGGVARNLKAASPYAVISLLLIFLERFDLYLIERDFPLSETGIYAAASKLVGSIAPIIASITAVFYSEMIAHDNKDMIYRHLRASVFWVLSLFAPIAGIIWLNQAELLRVVFGAAFESGGATLNILTIGVFGSAMILIFGFQLLALRRDWVPVFVGLSAAGVLGFALAEYLTPEFKTLGVAAGAVAGRFIGGLGIAAVAVRRWELPGLDLLSSALKSLTPMAGMLAASLALRAFGGEPSLLITSLAISAAVYILLFSLLNATEARLIWAKIQDRIHKHYN